MNIGVTCHPPGPDDDLERVRTTLVRVVIEPSFSDDDVRRVRDAFAVRPVLTPFALLAGGKIEKASGVRWERDELVAHGLRWWRIWKEQPMAVVPWVSSGNEPDISAWAGDPRGWGDVCLALHAALRAEGFTGLVCGGVSANMDRRGIDFAQGMDWSRMPAEMAAELHCYPRITSDRTIPHVGRDLNEQWDACHAAVNHHDIVIGEFGFNTAVEDHLGGLVTTQLTDDEAAQALVDEATHYHQHGCLAACVFVWNDETDHDAPCFGLRRADRTWKPQARAVKEWADAHLGSVPTRQLGVTVLGPEAEAISVAFSPGDQLPIVLGERDPGSNHFLFKDLPAWLSDGHIPGGSRIRAVGAGHIAFDEPLSVPYNSLPLAYELSLIRLEPEPVLVGLAVLGPSPADAVEAVLTTSEGSSAGVCEPNTHHVVWMLTWKAAGPARLRVAASGYETEELAVSIPIGGTELPPVTLKRRVVVQQPPVGDLLAWRGDFLTLRHPSGGDPIYSSLYLAYDATRRRRVIEAQIARGYPDILLDVLFTEQSGVSQGAFDFWSKPELISTGLSELVEAGLRPIPCVSFEDSGSSLAQYGGLDAFARGTMRSALAAWGHLISCVMIGVEIDEWATWDEALMLVERVGQCGRWPIALHFKPGVWGPHSGRPWSGGDQMAFWREAQRRASNRLAFAAQYEHPPREDVGRGFLSSDKDVEEWTRKLTASSRLGGLGIPVIAAEYAFLQDERAAQRLGAIAVRAGALGFLNGGPGPSVPSEPHAQDDLDLSQVTMLHRDVRAWPATSTITEVRIEPTKVCIEHTKAGQWPVVENGEGNPWVFAQIDGRWYGGTYEWLRPGQICKGVTRDDIGAHVKKAPLETWKPRSGELVGFMVSCRARDGVVAGEERSNVRLVRWP